MSPAATVNSAQRIFPPEQNNDLKDNCMPNNSFSNDTDRRMGHTSEAQADATAAERSPNPGRSSSLPSWPALVLISRGCR